MSRARLVVVVFGSACTSSGPREEVKQAPVPAPVAVTVDAPAIAKPIDAPPPAPPALPIVEAPIKWNDERAALTLDYRRQHTDPDAKDTAIEPRVVVLHYTAAGTAKSTQYYFDNVRLGTTRPELLRGGAVNVSAHFLVDRDGTIMRLQPETRYSRHCIGLNHIAIGVENVGDTKQWPLTDAQVAANIALVRDLARRFPITHLVGHHEVSSKTAYYVERDLKYRNDKPDPGPAFMKRVRDGVADLALKD